MLRVRSPQPDDLESLRTEVIGLCIVVHNELGPGLNERVYARACRVELDTRGSGGRGVYPCEQG